MNDLIIVKQLPIIEEQLQKLSLEIDEKLKNIEKLVVSEDTVKDIKNLRAVLNKEFSELEDQRKFVKTKVLKPYEDFENIYKEYVSTKYKTADLFLKTKIEEVEDSLKATKENEVVDFFNEYKQANNIDFIEFTNTNIKITLSCSMKSLKEEVKAFIDKVVNDLKTIDTMNHKDELKVEYIKTLDLNISIQTVNERFVQLEKIKDQATPEVVAEVKDESLSAPVEVIEEELLIATFKVRATKQKLLELKEFLEKGAYDCEF